MLNDSPVQDGRTYRGKNETVTLNSNPLGDEATSIGTVDPHLVSGLKPRLLFHIETQYPQDTT